MFIPVRSAGGGLTGTAAFQAAVRHTAHSHPNRAHNFNSPQSPLAFGGGMGYTNIVLSSKGRRKNNATY